MMPCPPAVIRPTTDVPTHSSGYVNSKTWTAWGRSETSPFRVFFRNHEFHGLFFFFFLLFSLGSFRNHASLKVFLVVFFFLAVTYHAKSVAKSNYHSLVSDLLHKDVLT